MKEEIAAAVFFVTRLAKRYGSLDNEHRDRLAATLTSVLFEKYKNHWDPEAPSRGQAYRCLRMNRLHHRDPVLELACIRSMVRYEDLGLPGELTLWVDPGEVSCRYGERTVPFCVSLVENSSGSDRRRAYAEFSRRIQSAVDRAFADVPSGSSSDEEDGGSSSSSSRDTSMLSSAGSSSRDTSMLSSAGSRDTSMLSSAGSRDTSMLSSSRDTSMVSSSSGGSGGSVSPPRSSMLLAQPQTIPTVSNPNSVYKIPEFSSGAPQSWVASSYPKRKVFPPGGAAAGGGEGFPSHPPPPPPPAFSGGHGGSHQHNATYRPYVRPSFIFSGPRVDKYHWVSKSRS